MENSLTVLWESAAAQRDPEDLGSPPLWKACIGILSCVGWGGATLPQVTAAVVQRQTASTYSGMRSDALGQSVRAAVYMLCIADGTEPAN